MAFDLRPDDSNLADFLADDVDLSGLNNANVTCEYCNKSKGTGDAPKNPKPCPSGQSCSQ